MRRSTRMHPSRHQRSIRQSAIGIFAGVVGFALAGCVVTFPSSQQQRIPNPMPSMPSSGSPQSTPPSPSSPSSLPSPPSLPSPSSPSPGLPSPSLPSPSLPSPSLPSPSLPSPSLPSPSAGAPSSSLPSASQPSGGGAAGNPSVIPPSGGGPQQGGGQGGLDLPAGGEDGNEAGGPDIGWEVSNETGDEPGAAGGRAGEQGTDDESGQPTGEDDAGGTEGGGPEDEGAGQVDALERALGELDGEILDERVATGGTQSGGPTGASDPQGNDAPAPPRAEPELARAPSTPLPPDRPDARDDDVVARQLREAAMAETDPELREQLWEEYRRYKAGL